MEELEELGAGSPAAGLELLTWTKVAIAKGSLGIHVSHSTLA